MSRYDDEMTKKQVNKLIIEYLDIFEIKKFDRNKIIKAEFDEVEGLHEEEKKLLDELEEKFKPLEEEYLKVYAFKFFLEK